MTLQIEVFASAAIAVQASALSLRVGILPRPNVGCIYIWARSMSDEKTNWPLRLVNIVLGVAGVFCLVWGCFALWQQNAAGAVTGLGAGLVLLLAATVDRFESLKGLGIEAKTRQLDNKLVEADETTKRLKSLAEVSSATLIDLSAKAGRVGGAPSPRQAIELADRVRDVLERLGSDAETIATTLRPFAWIMCVDVVAALNWKAEVVLTPELAKARERMLTDDRAALPMLEAEIGRAEAWRDRAYELAAKGTLEEFPGRLAALYDNVPLIDEAAAREMKDEAQAVVKGMRSLIAKRRIDDPERWIALIDARRKEVEGWLPPVEADL